MTLETLNEVLLAIGNAGQKPLYNGKPQRWWNNPHWRCTNNHVRTEYKPDSVGAAKCVECGEYALLTFCEDINGPLTKATA